MQQIKREGPGPAAPSALRDAALRPAAGERADLVTATDGAPRWRTEERQRYIAERARALALGVNEHERLALVEEQLRVETEARLEQIDVALESCCAGTGQRSGAGGLPRRLPLQALLASMRAGQAREFLEDYDATRESTPSTERLQALEQHAEALARAIERLTAAAYSMRSERSNSSGFEEA